MRRLFRGVEWCRRRGGRGLFFVLAFVQIGQDGQVVVWLLEMLENVFDSELEVELVVEQKEG